MSIWSEAEFLVLISRISKALAIRTPNAILFNYCPTYCRLMHVSKMLCRRNFHFPIFFCFCLLYLQCCLRWPRENVRSKLLTFLIFERLKRYTLTTNCLFTTNTIYEIDNNFCRRKNKMCCVHAIRRYPRINECYMRMSISSYWK